LAAEFPSEALAREVLGKIGSGEAKYTNIARAAGGINSASVSRALEILITKRIVTRETPLSTKASNEARYCLADPYLSLWLTFIGPHLAEIERGSADRVIERIKVCCPNWRGRAIGPIVREGLFRLLLFKGLTGETVGGYWTRTNVPEVDTIGADRSPLANVITFAGSIKWLVTEVFSHSDLSALASESLLVERLPVLIIGIDRLETSLLSDNVTHFLEL
jgi:hypothetical protein